MSKTILALAAVSVFGSATLTTADTSYFSIDRLHDNSSTLELGLVRSASDAVIEVYDFHLAEVGVLLGTANVTSGANQHVRVNLGANPVHDVIAILKSGDTVLATKKIDIDRF